MLKYYIKVPISKADELKTWRKTKMSYRNGRTRMDISLEHSTSDRFMLGLNTPYVGFSELDEECRNGGIEISDDWAHPNGHVDLLISSSMRDHEQDVQELRGSGIITARYSLFYGEPSGYTGLSPEESGFALDISRHPRIDSNHDVIRTMLRNEQLLDGLVNRSEERIGTALDDINADLDEPILVTPYLQEALRISSGYTVNLLSRRTDHLLSMLANCGVSYPT